MIDLNELVTWLTLGQVTITTLLSIYVIAAARARLAQATVLAQREEFLSTEDS